MEPERWGDCIDVFHEALERSPDEQPAFLGERCRGDEALLRQVELLLKYHRKSGDFIESPAFEIAPELLADDPDTLIGQRLGPYRIDAVLGIGGMGVVYLACDEKLGRNVAIKLMPPSLVADKAQLERLEREARTASALNHPNIVTIHEIGEVDSIHYIATEFIDGITLRERIAQGPVSPDEALDIAMQLASALCVAHAAGIVHRDIKPENIMLRPDGYVKMLDFGIAKFTQPLNSGGVGEAQALTQRGIILGTTRYMSPEQARGQPVDGRSDIWSLGVVLYEMLTHGPPFTGETATDIMAAVLLIEPQPVHKRDAIVSPALERIVERTLKKNPSERFQSAEEMLSALRAAKEKTRAWQQVHLGFLSRAFRHRGRMTVFISVALALLAAGVILLGRSRSGTIGPLHTPTGLAVSSAGDIYVADAGTHTICRITPAGKVSTFAGVAGTAGVADGTRTQAQFHRPADVAIDDQGNIYVADTDNFAIRKITPTGVVSTFAGVPGVPGSDDGAAHTARFRYPTGVDTDNEGNVYVADFRNSTVRKITSAGTVTTLAGVATMAGSEDGIGSIARFNQAHEVAVDGEHAIYVADFSNHTIRRITPDGVVSTLAGLAGQAGHADGTGSKARFHEPYSVAVDRSSNVYVADTSNHTIRKIAPSGQVSTLAGLAGTPGHKDGGAHDARFNLPTSVAVDSTNNVYVADYGNHSVRKISPAGEVSTLARGQ